MDLRIFLEAQPHTLLVGDEDLAQSLLATYQRHLGSPIVEWRPPAPLKAPPVGTPTTAPSASTRREAVGLYEKLPF